MAKTGVEFQVGDEVQWTSSCTDKFGEVVRVIAPNEDPGAVVRQLAKELNATDAYGGGYPRKAKSYLVLVKFPGTRRKPRIYWPNVTQLRPA